MKILFAVLIIICIVFYVMYLWDFALVLLAAIVSVPVIMFITTFITKRLIDVDFALKDDSVSKNESFPVNLCVNNRSIFPIGKAEARIEYSNVCSSDVSSFNLLMPIQARNTQSISFQLKSRYCGMLCVRCAYIVISDPLKLFKFKVGKNICTSIAVLPEGHDISGQVSFTDKINEESSVFSEYKAGDDPSEVFDLRDYNPGDKLNRIHWKLSSKKNEFIVKDYSLPVDIPCTMLVDLGLGGIKKECIMPVFDTLVETFVSVSQFLIENERVHSIVYYSSAHSRFIERTVDSADSLAELTKEIILSLREGSTCASPEAYFIDQNRISLSSFIYITAETDPTVLEFIDENIDADIKNAIVVVPSPEDAAAVEGISPDINILPVVIGRISTSIKDIEL